MSGQSAVLVEVSSATFGSTKKYPINSTHSDLVKFGGEEDEAYQEVLSHMEKIETGPTGKSMDSRFSDKPIIDCSHS